MDIYRYTRQASWNTVHDDTGERQIAMGVKKDKNHTYLKEKSGRGTELQTSLFNECSL